jgi:SAM-dependent methyltransferase
MNVNSFQENSYGLVYSAWLGSQKLSDQEVAQMLRALRPSLQQLRTHYRPGGGAVHVEYEGATAEAYLLAYVPLYIHQAEKVLGCAFGEMEVDSTGELRVGLLCPGPGPELIALVRLLNDTWPSPPNLNVTYFDIANDGWSKARSGLLRCANGIYEPRSVNTEIVNIDLRANLSPDMVGQFADFDIVVAQNMVNEVADSEQALSNLRNIVSSLKHGTLVVVSDQANYDAVIKAKEAFTQDLKVIHDEAKRYDDFYAPPAGLLKEHFFGPWEDDLMWKRALNVVEWIGVKHPAGRN